MTHTVEVIQDNVMGRQRVVEMKVTISSYTSGGENVTELRDYFAKLDLILAMPVTGSTAFFITDKDDDTATLKLWTATGTQFTTGYPAVLKVMAFGA